MGEPSTLVAGTVTSTQTGDWGNQSTWDCSCTPADSDDVVIDSGHTVTLSSNEQVACLTIKDDAVLDDGSNDLEVTSNFTLDGTYTTMVMY
ncbi:MAG: hypothetical protein BRD50_05190 [Bacteroidetes bacterium SW_11_45_7]|nr:MAG: hypothetical protein BRD50_05190 [Bacteroidetes bacterium SW_11_45_7]